MQSGLARAEPAPWRHDPLDTPPTDAPGAVQSRSRRGAVSARRTPPQRATTPPPPPARLGRGVRGAAVVCRGALAAIPEAPSAGEGPPEASPALPAPRWTARPSAAALRAAEAAAPLHAATAAALGGGLVAASAAVASVPLRRKRKAVDALAAAPLAQLAAFFQQVDDSELPEEAEPAKHTHHGGGASAPSLPEARPFKKARRPLAAPRPPALAAAALATPSPARAVAMYPSLTTDYDLYTRALKRGAQPMPFPEFVTMMTSRRRQADQMSSPAAIVPRMAGALLD